MTPIVSPERPGALRPQLTRHARPIFAGLLSVAGVAATFGPAGGFNVEWIGLLLLCPVVIWCALPVHLAALGGIASGRLTAWVLASVGVVAALAWSIHAVAADDSSDHLVPLALATFLVVVAQHVSDLAGQDASDDPAPTWLPPAVLGVSASALIVWWLVDGSRSGVAAGLAVLLGSAPVALMMAGPAALVVSGRRGAEIGVQSADEGSMRAATRIDTIVLAKDGTVTTGELSVMAVDPVEPDHLRNLRWFAGALAHTSDHPVARAISKLAPRGRVSNVVNQPLLGLSGAVDRHPVRIGLPGWLEAEGPEGLGTQVAVEVDGRALGWITVGDTVRPDARQGVERLGQLGLDPILVSERSAADTTDLALQTGIGTSFPLTTVEACVALVQRLRSEGRVVAMAGESAAQAPALQAADLAISTAGERLGNGIVLVDVDVQRVGDVVELMRSTLATMLTNRRWAVIGMLVPMVITAAGLVEPLFAPLFALAGVAGVVMSSSRISRSERTAVDQRD